MQNIFLETHPDQIFKNIIQKMNHIIEEIAPSREEQHGGKSQHSNLTAKLVLEEAAERSIDRNRLRLIVSTNLTAAFDTVDHKMVKK